MTTNITNRTLSPINALLPDSDSILSLADGFTLPPIPSRKQQGLDEGRRLAIYIAGSRAHQHFLQPLGITAYQIGVTSRRNVMDRIKDKRHRRYGSVLMDPKHPESGSQCLRYGHDICLIRIWHEMLEGVKVPPGLAIVDGVIEVRLAQDTTTEQADKRISQSLAPRSLYHYLASAEGQERLVQAGYNPRHLLTTEYTDIGTEPRYSTAEEIYLIRPKREMQTLLNVLAEALEGILYVAK